MRAQRGFSLIELVVTMSLFAVILGIAVLNFKDLDSDHRNGAAQLLGFLKQARAKAVNSTLAYTVSPQGASTTRIIATFGTTCAASQTADPAFVLELPGDSYLGNTGWSICYTSRGLSQSSADIQVRDGSESKTVRVVLGGGAKVL